MKRLRQVAWGLVLALILVGVGWRTRADYFSCDKCRSRKNVTARSVFGITLHTSELLMPSGKDMGCTHDWWRYGRTEYYGPFGIITKSVSSKPKEFKEGPNNTSEGIRQPADGLPKPSM